MTGVKLVSLGDREIERLAGVKNLEFTMTLANEVFGIAFSAIN